MKTPESIIKTPEKKLGHSEFCFGYSEKIIRDFSVENSGELGFLEHAPLGTSYR
jgi:hypothetical protein